MWPFPCCVKSPQVEDGPYVIDAVPAEYMNEWVDPGVHDLPSLLANMNMANQADANEKILLSEANSPKAMIFREADAFPAKPAASAFLGAGGPEVAEGGSPEDDNEEVLMDMERSGSTDSEQDEIEALIEERVVEAKRTWIKDQVELDRSRRTRELEALIAESRLCAKQHSSAMLLGGWRPASRYGTGAQLPAFDRDKHVPILGLINPRSGAASGADILKAARDTPYYQDRFFNIIDVVKSRKPGGLLDVFRQELVAAKNEAMAMKVRPRIVSGGGDGTASFTLFIIFSALKADNSRPEKAMHDRGNGFIWTEEELRDYFPAVAQMPLGSANDFAHTLGWGQKYPGDPAGNCFATRKDALQELHRWIRAVIGPRSRVVNFDLWGIMPKPGEEQADFKICELTGQRGFNPKGKDESGAEHLMMKVAGTPVPFFVCLYFSAGFAAYTVARFQINRRKHPLTNNMEYARQAWGIATERKPEQLEARLDKIRIDCGQEHYFPPNADVNSKAGQKYRDVGFFNINWQANAMHAADRAPACTRLTGVREPAKFNDGHVDMYRYKFRSLLKNPGLKFQTDKKKDMTLTFEGGQGKGIFFQWDGEARFAFSLSGEPFRIHIRKVMNIPVVLGPDYREKVAGDPSNGHDAFFEFSGDDADSRAAVRARVLKYVEGDLEQEMNATQEELDAAGMARYPQFDL
mmetsp:Transcript_29250/g.74389  ORF Transcript_29250/g.74389 Transcript_29250/m.74389 type:complete len:692 (-) Transcript_29250:378-2453(-)